MAFKLWQLREAALIASSKWIARIRDSRIPIVLERIGLRPEEAVELNIADTLAGRRVSRKVLVPRSLYAGVREISLDRAAREAVAVILESNVEAGYPLDPAAPLFIEFEPAWGNPGERLSASRLRQIVNEQVAFPSV
jgi:hypothetical protein